MARKWWTLTAVVAGMFLLLLDLTVMNLALPSAQRALGFTNADRQWIVTPYSLSFGSLLLFCGRLADLIGRKVAFLAGLAGFAAASAVGGASVSFTMLVTARACQGVFAALLAPSALSLLATGFTDPKERGKAFGVYGAVAASGSGLGLLIGGALTSYASWRWCMSINLVFAAIAITGGTLLLGRQLKMPGARLDVPGVAAVSGGMFCLVYGFSNAATHSWHTLSTWSFLAARALLLVIFAAWQSRAAHPLLPPRVVVDRNRGGAYLTMPTTGAGMVGIFLFLIYYMLVTLGYSAVISGVALLPVVVIGATANVGNIVLMPRLAPIAAGQPRPAAQWGRPGLADQDRRAFGVRLGPDRAAHGDRCQHGLRILLGDERRHLRRGTARRRGVASGSINIGSQLGGSIGTSLLNTIAATATTSYLDGRPAPQLVQLTAIYGTTTACAVPRAADPRQGHPPPASPPGRLREHDRETRNTGPAGHQHCTVVRTGDGEPQPCGRPVSRGGPEVPTRMNRWNSPGSEPGEMPDPSRRRD